LIARVVASARELDDDELGGQTPGLAFASARHETQYTRLFRS
jgi:urease accessory protein UreF